MQSMSDDDIAPALIAQLRAEAVVLGLYGFNLPARLGGPGLSADAKLAILEEITYTSAPLTEAAGYLPLSLNFCNAERRTREQAARNGRGRARASMTMLLVSRRKNHSRPGDALDPEVFIAPATGALRREL